MVRDSEVVATWVVDLEKLLVLPTFGMSGVSGETHDYNGHVHHNIHKACSYE